MYMQFSCCVFLCTHARYNVLVFQKNGVLFGNSQKVLGFSKKIRGLKKCGVSQDFEGNQGQYTQVSRVSDLTGWHVCAVPV